MKETSELIDDLCKASMSWGYLQDQATNRVEAETSKQVYQKARKDMEARAHYLETVTVELKKYLIVNGIDIPADIGVLPEGGPCSQIQ